VSEPSENAAESTNLAWDHSLLILITRLAPLAHHRSAVGGCGYIKTC
jgi:hypothetical protein